MGLGVGTLRRVVRSVNERLKRRVKLGVWFHE